MNFVKTAKPYTPIKNEKGAKTGVVIEEYWKNKFKQIFRKLPDIDSTIDYLIKVFKEQGFDLAKEIGFDIVE